MSLKEATLEDMERVGLSLADIKTVEYWVDYLLETTSKMAARAEDHDEPDSLYDDLSGEAANVMNSLFQLRQRIGDAPQ